MTLRTYLRSTHPALLAFDLVRVFGLFCAPLVGLVLFRWLASTDAVLAPFHRRLWYNAGYADAGSFYRWFVAATFLLTLQQDWGGKYAPDHAYATQSPAAGTVAAAPLHRSGLAPVADYHPTAQRARQTLTPQTALGQTA